MGHKPVHLIRGSSLFILIKKALLYDLFYIIILLIDNLFFIIAWKNHGNIVQRMIVNHHLVKLQELNSMPAHIIHLAVLFIQRFLNQPDFLLHLLAVAYNHPLRSLLIVVDHCVHQHIQSCPFPG